MRINLNQDEILEAITAYAKNQGISLHNKTVDIKLSTNKPKDRDRSFSAVVDIESATVVESFVTDSEDQDESDGDKEEFFPAA